MCRVSDRLASYIRKSKATLSKLHIVHRLSNLRCFSCLSAMKVEERRREGMEARCSQTRMLTDIASSNKFACSLAVPFKKIRFSFCSAKSFGGKKRI